MNGFWSDLIVNLGGALLLVGLLMLVGRYVYGRYTRRRTGVIIARFLRPPAIDSVTIRERRFPMRIRADLQLALEALLPREFTTHRFLAIPDSGRWGENTDLSSIIASRETSPVATAAKYDEIDVGDARPIRCLTNGLWLLEREGRRCALFMTTKTTFTSCGPQESVRIELAGPQPDESHAVAEWFFGEVEKAVQRSNCYRGKVLSFEAADDYRGTDSGITVHRLRTVTREQVILPPATLELLERNVLRFVGQRERLRSLGVPTKKGLLFYGPPGTGKTHTIHYLSRALEGHTTLLIAAEQVGYLSEYMTLARLLQPSIVVIEDADLIARERREMGAREEVLLNKLLNEMDGLRADADILFILTTNRPEAIEKALSARPGRIDQAIEFPLPDEEGRAKLIRLYAAGAALDEATVGEIVGRTERTSAAFIKELMRRALQFHFERNGTNRIEVSDVQQALDEMLLTGGSLNRTLLGGMAESA